MSASTSTSLTARKPEETTIDDTEEPVEEEIDELDFSMF